MRFFDHQDMKRAIEAFRERREGRDPVLLGRLSGIKRRARSAAILEFALNLSPAPPDSSITTVRHALVELFRIGISNNELQSYFATRGRKANDRVDLVKWDAWWVMHRSRFHEEAALLLLAIESEWRKFSEEAAQAAR